MRLWTLFPDELARAYVWRLRSDNVLSSNDEPAAYPYVVEEGRGIRTGTANVGRGNRKRTIDRLMSLLRRLEMTPAELVCGHSLVPVTKCVTTFDLSVPNRPDFGDDRYLGFALWSGGHARLCRDCVAEDLSHHGVSYWRRSHQLPGVTWCTKHYRPLSELRCQNAFSKSPSVALSEVVDVSTREVYTATKSEVVNRYVSILEGLLENARAPVHTAGVAYLIRNQAAARGLKVSPWRDRPYLSDAALEQLPVRWLEMHFPASRTKRPRAFAPWIDRAVHPRVKPVGAPTLALSLAILWSNPEDALNAFLGANEHAQEPLLKPRKKFNLSGEAMCELWLRHKGRHHQIAKEVGLCPELVRSRFKEVGLIALGNMDFGRIEAAGERYVRDRVIVAASYAEGVKVQALQALILAKGYFAA
jgi:hypothetical protein